MARRRDRKPLSVKNSSGSSAQKVHVGGKENAENVPEVENTSSTDKSNVEKPANVSKQSYYVEVVDEEVEFRFTREDVSAEEDGSKDACSIEANNEEPAVTTKNFYGNSSSASTNGFVAVNKRLQQLSFTARDSYVSTPENERVLPRTKVVRKRVGVKARTTKNKTNTIKPLIKKKAKSATQKRAANPSKCCHRKAVHLPEELETMQSTLITLKKSPRKPLAENKFIKHHFPARTLKVHYKGGEIIVIPGSSEGKTSGKIDFDFKDGDVSHVAEDGGKCVNFGLESVDDLERSGVFIPTTEIGVDLRKRKATKANVNAKRRRPSSWRYEENKAPVPEVPSGLSMVQYEDAQVRLKLGIKQCWVVVDKLPDPKPPRTPRRKSTKESHKTPAEPANEAPPMSPIPTADILEDYSMNSPSCPPSPAASEPPSSPVFNNSVVLATSTPKPPQIPQDISLQANTTLNEAPSKPDGDTSKPVSDQAPAQSSTTVALKPKKRKYDPREDAFGFDNIDSPNRVVRVRKMVDSLLVVASPEKKPKELTPKAEKNKQLSIRQVLAMKDNKAVTPILSRGLVMNPTQTSTPVDGAPRGKSFYGRKPQVENGFDGFRRILDRMGERQLQIDAGQKRYGAGACLKCGMVYSQGEAQDEKEHNKFHLNLLNAIKFKGWPDAHVVDLIIDKGKVLRVHPQDKKHMTTKLENVMRYANRTIGFDEESIRVDAEKYPDRTYLVFHTKDDKFGAVIAAEPWTNARMLIPGEPISVDDRVPFTVKHSVILSGYSHN